MFSLNNCIINCKNKSTYDMNPFLETLDETHLGDTEASLTAATTAE